MRIFTPAVELPFAGHPSIGTACTLVSIGRVAPQEPVTEATLELNVGPTVVDVTVRAGQAVAGVVHQVRRPSARISPATRRPPSWASRSAT